MRLFMRRKKKNTCVEELMIQVSDASPPVQDIALLNAGKPAQHTAEVDRELDKAESTIRLLFNDVQMLKDGRHPQAEQMYRR